MEIAPSHTQPLLLSDRQSVQLNPVVNYRLDVAEFERALQQAGRGTQDGRMASLSDAVALYRGDFLEDIFVPDSEAFENWAGQVRERLRRRALDALYEIGEIGLDLGDYKRAQDMARRQIAIDELHEAAYRLLMLALSAGGQRNEALTEFARLKQLLADELNVEPAGETAGLAEAIRQGEYSPEYAPKRGQTPEHQAASEPVSIVRQAEPISREGIKIDDTVSHKSKAAGELRQIGADDQALALTEQYEHSLKDDEAADQQAAEPPSNLPYELNRFVGRQEHIAAIIDLFEQENTRLVSFKELGTRRGIVVALRVGALVAVYEGDFDRADRLAEESLNLAQELEALIEAANAKVVIGLSAHAQARLAKARRWFLESLESFREVNDRRNIAHTLVGLARTAYRLDDHSSAQEYLEESLSLSREFSIQWSLAYSLEIMGLLRRSEDDYSHALLMFQESLRLSSEQENRQGIANCLGAIAGLATMLGQPGIGVRIFAATEQVREGIGGRMGLADREEYEACLQLARSQMDEAAFSTSWSDGQGMGTKQAIGQALSVLEA